MKKLLFLFVSGIFFQRNYSTAQETPAKENKLEEQQETSLPVETRNCDSLHFFRFSLQTPVTTIGLLSGIEFHYSPKGSTDYFGGIYLQKTFLPWYEIAAHKKILSEEKSYQGVVMNFGVKRKMPLNLFGSHYWSAEVFGKYLDLPEGNYWHPELAETSTRHKQYLETGYRISGGFRVLIGKEIHYGSKVINYYFGGDFRVQHLSRFVYSVEELTVNRWFREYNFFPTVQMGMKVGIGWRQN